jgi:mannose-6-phosphate isomerase class I
MYYIMEARPGSRVNIGLNADVKREKFHHAAKLADEKAIPFDYRDHVNSVPTKKHDLLQVPPGTVHGSGEGQVVLEISATTYRYTFKIYDHLRPDLSGVMRPIHVGHAFNVIKWFRRGDWVAKNLIQEPHLVRSGAGWAEYLIADRREFFHLVFRLEFKRAMNDDTAGQFHIHTLVEGDEILIESLADPAKRLKLRYSETVVVPACFGRYRLVNLGRGLCKTVKACLR